MTFAILDTGVYIEHLERGRFASELSQLNRQFVIRGCAVVLSELRRGARTQRAIQLVESMHQAATVIWAPTSDDWWRAGQLVQSIGDEQDWETNKRREFQNDALIALTALRHGACVITTNAQDFALLAKAISVHVMSLR